MCLELCVSFFGREWKLFNYETRNVKFADEAGSPEGKNGFCGINLPQFSSATIPKVRKILLFFFFFFFPQ